MPIYNNSNQGVPHLYEVESDLQTLTFDPTSLELTISQGNTVDLSSLSEDTDLTALTPQITSTASANPLALDINNYYYHLFQIDCTGETTSTFTVANPVVGGVYTFEWVNVTSMDITFPANFVDETGTAFGTPATYTDDVMYTFRYDGTDFKAKAV